jgi:hypothetical protein
VCPVIIAVLMGCKTQLCKGEKRNRKEFGSHLNQVNTDWDVYRGKPIWSDRVMIFRVGFCKRTEDSETYL